MSVFHQKSHLFSSKMGLTALTTYSFAAFSVTVECLICKAEVECSSPAQRTFLTFFLEFRLHKIGIKSSFSWSKSENRDLKPRKTASTRDFTLILLLPTFSDHPLLLFSQKVEICYFFQCKLHEWANIKTFYRYLQLFIFSKNPQLVFKNFILRCYNPIFSLLAPLGSSNNAAQKLRTDAQTHRRTRSDTTLFAHEAHFLLMY